MTTDEQLKLPTPEQWELVYRMLKEAALSCRIQELDSSWDYMLDDTELELAQLVREQFPELDAICLASAREWVKHCDEDRGPVRENEDGA